MNNQFNRRDAIKRGGVALAATAVAMTVTSGARADVSGEAARDLWRRYIEACLRYGEASHAHDEADSDARNERGDMLVCPWTPLAQAGEWQTSISERSASRLNVEQVLADTTVPQGGVGPWLVKEYQPSAKLYPYTENRDGCPVRWQPYPEAKTAAEAYGMAKARTDQEWRSFRAQAGAIQRKHKVRPLEAEMERRHDVTVAIAREIAEAPYDCPVAGAVKMALGFSGFMGPISDDDVDPYNTDPDTGFAIVDCEHLAMGSIYRELVKSGGYDPYADWRATPFV